MPSHAISASYGMNVRCLETHTPIYQRTKQLNENKMNTKAINLAADRARTFRTDDFQLATKP